MAAPESRPWHREPWPWFLIAVPAASIIMGIVLWLVALRSQDGLVVDDYYKQGLAINQVIEREARAEALGLRASLMFNPERTRVRLTFDGDATRSSETLLRLIHPTRAGLDQTIALLHAGGDVWDGALAAPTAGRWRILLEDAAGGWRLTGTWHTDETRIVLGRGIRPAEK